MVTMKFSDLLLVASLIIAFAIVGTMDYQDAELASNHNRSVANER